MSIVSASLILLACFLAVRCQRLQTAMDVEHYDLILLPIVAGDRPQLCGHASIDFRVTSTTNKLAFHSVGLKLADVEVRTRSAEKNDRERRSRVEDLCFFGLSDSLMETVQFVHGDQSGDETSVITKDMLYPGIDYQLDILYTGRMHDGDTIGFFRGSYTDPGSCCQRWFGATQMEIAHAREVLPCLDEPSYKATFKVTLGHESKMAALSNMPDVATASMSGTNGWAWTEFETTPKMPTYILAFVITDFEHETIEYRSDNRTVALRFWAKPGQLTQLRHLMDSTPQMLHFLETYLDEPFSLPKIDFYAPPTQVMNFLAMENWGLITFSEARYYFDADKDSKMTGFEILQTLAHELAHQYFGNLVTTDWWSEIWLTEGFAGFFEFEIAQQVLPSYLNESDKNRADGAINSHRTEETDGRGRPISFPVNSPKEAEQNFDILSYSKGNNLLRMLQHLIGHENFRKGLVAFFDEYKYKTANSTHLWDTLNKQTQKDKRIGNRLNVREVMESWTHQPSFPVITCTRTPTGKIKLSQRKFPRTPSNYKLRPWWVPVNIANGKTADFSPRGMLPRLWLSPERREIEVAVTIDKTIGPLDNETWVLINGEFTSYARVNYDDLNWRLLSRQLIANYTRIPQLSRIKMIDDAFTFGVSGMLDFNIALGTIDYLATEHDEHILPTALRHLRDIKAAVKDNATMVELLQDYIDKVTQPKEPLFSELTRSANKVERSKLTRSYCDSDDNDCVNQAIELYTSVIEGSATEDEERLVREEFDWIGCAVIRHGNNIGWRFAWKQSLANRTTSREKIYKAMACSASEKRIKQLLSRVLQPTIDQQPEDTEAIIRSLAEGPSRPFALSFLIENWSFLEKHLKDDPLALLESVTSQSSDSKEMRKIAEFLRSQKFKGKEASKAENIVSTMRKNVEFVKTQSDNLYRALSSSAKKQTRR